MATKASITSSPSSSPSPTPTANMTSLNQTVTMRLPTLSRDPFWKAMLLSVQVVSSLEAVLIISTNLLLLFLILSSPLLRSRMRNKLVVSVVVANMLVGVLGSPFTVDYSVRERWVHSCYVTIIIILLCFVVQNFITMWGVVALLLHYLARLTRYEGPGWIGRLPDPLQRALPGMLIASPWLIALLVLVPMIFGGLDRAVLTVWSVNECPFVLEKWAQNFLGIVTFYVPALVLIALIIIIIVLRGRREEKQDHDGRMEEGGQAVMCDLSQDLESCWVHVLGASLTVLMMGPEHIFPLVGRSGSWKGVMIGYIVVHLLSDLLPLVLALVWLLLLQDVRSHLKEMLLKLLDYVLCWRARSPPQAPGSTSISPVAFKDLHDE